MFMKVLQRIGVSVGFVLFSVLWVSSVVAAPAKAPVLSAVPSPTETPTPIEYVLPYPGLLPTHPLYVIKHMRDQIIEMLITDPVSKAEFYILQADKKLNMGISLQESFKTQEADSIFNDALVSRGKAVNLLESHFKSGNTMPGHLSDKLFLSLDKHREVLRSVGKNTDAITALRVKADQSLRLPR